MEEWIGGNPYIEENNKKNMYQMVSLIKQSLFHKEKFPAVDMIKMMKKSQRRLKKIDLINTRSEIEYEKYENTFLSSLRQDRYIAKFYLFAPILGYIDSKINTEKATIDFNSNFLWADKSNIETYHKNEIEKSKEQIREYLKYREEILEDYLSILDKRGSFEEITYEVLKTIPSYNKFGDLYKDLEKHILQPDIHQHLINAYNLGYMNKDVNYVDQLNKYRFLFNDLYLSMQQNQANLEAIRNVKKAVKKKN